MNNKIDMNQLMELAVKHQAMQQPQQVKSGITYCELLSVVLVTLKCLGLISCSWIVPFLPLTIPFVLYGIVFILGIIKAKFFR